METILSKLHPSLIILLIGLTACTSKEDQVSGEAPLVRVQKIQHDHSSRTRTFAGITQAETESELSFRVSGLVETLAVKVGDKVNKNDLLAALDPHEFKLQVREKKATLAKAAANRRRALAHYRRLQELYETKSATRAELDQARAEAESSSASVESAQTAYELAKSNLDYTTLLAPHTGAIAKLEIGQHEYTRAGNPILWINSTHSLEVAVPIPEIWISDVKEGMKTTIQFSSMPEQFFSAVVTEVGVSSHSGAAFTVVVEATDQTPNIPSGIASEVTFYFPKKENPNQIFVPAHAINQKTETPFVFVANQKEETFYVEKRAVQIGAFSNDGIEIVSGLHPGELLITAGIPFLSDGKKVRISK